MPSDDRPKWVDGPLTKAVRAELAALDAPSSAFALESAVGAACIAMAGRIDADVDSGYGLVSLTRELQASLEAIGARAGKKAPPDELGPRRVRRFS